MSQFSKHSTLRLFTPWSRWRWTRVPIIIAVQPVSTQNYGEFLTFKSESAFLQDEARHTWVSLRHLPLGDPANNQFKWLSVEVSEDEWEELRYHHWVTQQTFSWCVVKSVKKCQCCRNKWSETIHIKIDIKFNIQFNMM